jgi:hypothetical protein
VPGHELGEILGTAWAAMVVCKAEVRLTAEERGARTWAYDLVRGGSLRNFASYLGTRVSTWGKPAADGSLPLIDSVFDIFVLEHSGT